MNRIQVSSFDEIEEEFIRRAHTAVWCSMATLDTGNRLRSRIMHPFWEGAVGWVATRRGSLKAKHLARNPHASLAYIADVFRPVYVDCTAEWDDSTGSKRYVWEKFSSLPPPLGYDPAIIFQSIDDADYGVLRLAPWRVELFDMLGETRVWRRQS
ncbi:MAG: pyridoxamine 5'-phosphate oxidase family protein [Acidobacteriota bacterium]